MAVPEHAEPGSHSDVSDPTDPSSPTGAAKGRMSRSERRSQLLDAAREVFVASGYHAAAMDDIAAKAGISNQRACRP